MQRSIVKEFKYDQSSLSACNILGMNSVLYSNRSPAKDSHSLSPHVGVTTPSTSNSYNLQKSRIAKIPNYRKEALEPSHVVIFQAIEIIRLCQELQSTNSQIKDLHRNIFNSNNYEVQIKELIDKCNKLDEEKHQYSQQLSQHKEASQQIYHELQDLKSRYQQVDLSLIEKYKLQKIRTQELTMQIEKWKTRYQILDKNRSEQIDHIKSRIDDQRTALTVNTNKLLYDKMQTERQEMSFKLREKKTLLQEKQLQMKKLMNLYQQCQITMKQDHNKIELYQEKVALLSQETYRLNEVLRIKIEQLNHLKINNQHQISLRMSDISYRDQEKQLITQKVRFQEEETYKIRAHNTRLEEECIDLKRKLIEFQKVQFQLKEAQVQSDSKSKQVQKKNKKVFDLEDRLSQLQRILQKDIGMLNEDKINAINKLEQLKKTIYEKSQELKRVKGDCAKIIQNYQLVQVKFAKSVDQFQKQYSQIQNKLNSLKNVPSKDIEKEQCLENALKAMKHQNVSLIEDLDRRNRQVKEKSLQLTTKNQQLEQSHQTVISIQQQFSHRQSQEQVISKQLKQLQKILYQKENQNSQLKAEIRVYSEKVLGLEQQSMRIHTEFMEVNNRLGKIQVIFGNLKKGIQTKINMYNESEIKRKDVEKKFQLIYTWFQKHMLKPSQLEALLDKSNISKNQQDLTISHMVTGETSQIFQLNQALGQGKEQGYAMGSSIYSYTYTRTKGKNVVNCQNNMNKNNNKLNILKSQQLLVWQVPQDFLLKYVLLCAEVQSLRKKVGDKNAKVESMRSNILSGNSGNNIRHQRTFSTSRDSAINKATVYY